MTVEVHKWVEADGTEHTLTEAASGVAVKWGIEGRFMPPVELVVEEVPLQPGARLRTVKTKLRTIDLPLRLRGSTQADLRTKIRDVLKWFDPARGDGRYRITDHDAAEREITARYAGGLGGVETVEGNGLLSQLFVVAIECLDPYWQATADTVATFTTGAEATFFPFFPLRLSSSEIFNDAVVANAGDVEAWPVWVITGPGSNPVLRNLTTTKLLDLSANGGVTLAAGETATIDTRPGVKTIERNDGLNLFKHRTAASSLWPLPAGSNSVRIELTAASAASSVQLNYRRRYRSA